jgi:hypothetical protein
MAKKWAESIAATFFEWGPHNVAIPFSYESVVAQIRAYANSVNPVHQIRYQLINEISRGISIRKKDLNIFQVSFMN